MSLANGGAKIVEAVGYAAGSEVPVFTKTYATDGTMSVGTGVAVPGDCAGLVRYSTPARSSKNHPIYCFSYYHTVRANAFTGNNDQVDSAQLTAYGTYAALWLSGISDGASAKSRATPNSVGCTGHFEEPLITHRDLPR